MSRLSAIFTLALSLVGCASVHTESLRGYQYRCPVAGLSADHDPNREFDRADHCQGPEQQRAFGDSTPRVDLFFQRHHRRLSFLHGLADCGRYRLRDDQRLDSRRAHSYADDQSTRHLAEHQLLVDAERSVNSTISPTATASSGLPVTFTSLTPAVCSTSQTFIGGTCSIQATQPGNSTYKAANPSHATSRYRSSHRASRSRLRLSAVRISKRMP